MFVVDGTAHDSLEWSIVEKARPTQLSEIVRAIQAAKPVAQISRVPDANAKVFITPQRDLALVGLDTYGYDNWDSDGAKAISLNVVHWSRGVLRALSDSVPNPDIAPAASGSVCMEWMRGDDFVWVDVEPNGRLLTLVRISGKKAESSFDIGDSEIQKHIATALTQLYA